MSHLMTMRMMIMRVFLLLEHISMQLNEKACENEIGFNVSLSPPNRNPNILNVGGKEEK